MTPTDLRAPSNRASTQARSCRSRALAIVLGALTAACTPSPRPSDAPPPVASVSATSTIDAAAPLADAPSLRDLQERYGRIVYEGMRRLRVPNVPGEEHIVGDNDDPAGMTWTKCANLGVDLLVTLAAERGQILPAPEAADHVAAVLETLSTQESWQGIFPEVIKLEPAPPHLEILEGRIHYSSIDAAWATVAVSLVEARYAEGRPDLAAKAHAILAKQDYRVFVADNGYFNAGVLVDPKTRQKAEMRSFSYDDRNSEARPLVLALLAMGKVPETAWELLRYAWGESQGVQIAKGWNFSAFVEMTGALFFDEASLAPSTLGYSHANYVEASVRVAKVHGQQVFGYAPGCDAAKGYSEFGLERPDVAFPYAAGELLMSDDPRARSNLDRMMRFLPLDGQPLPDAVLPATGAIYCKYARTLDQGLLFLSLYYPELQALVRKTSWYPAAAQRLRDFDLKARPPGPSDAGSPAPASPTSPRADAR